MHEGDYTVAWSIYFLDPDGHEIEITTYDPPDEFSPADRSWVQG